MLRLFVLSLTASAVAVALLAPAGARAADEPKDILAKAIKAYGGEETLTKYKAAELKSKGKINIPGVGESDYTQETAFMIPDKFRDSMELTINGMNIPVKTLVNGDKILIEVSGKELELGDNVKAAIKDVGHLLEIQQLVPLKDKKYELSIIGEDKVEGKKVVGVLVSTKGKKDVSIYFYQDTGLIAKVEYRTVDANSGNEITEERIITEYKKDDDGHPIPKTVTVKRDGKKFIEAEVTEYKKLEKLDDSVFTK